MKKSLFVVAVAAFTLMGCTNEKNEFVGNGSEQTEIAFMPLTQVPTRVVVEGTSFPSAQDMYVAAYDATGGKDYFGQTTFSEATGVWKANPPKYWPMNAATLNFLAYTGVPSGSFFDGTHPAQKLTIALGDNSSNQYDLMYACGRQSRALNTAASNVSMVLLSPAIVVFRRVTVLFNSSIFLLCSSFFTFNKSKSIVEVLVKLVNKSAKAG